MLDTFLSKSSFDFIIKFTKDLDVSMAELEALVRCGIVGTKQRPENHTVRNTGD